MVPGTQEMLHRYILNECCLLASCLVPLIPVLPSALPSREIFTNTQVDHTARLIMYNEYLSPASSFLGALPSLSPQLR